ncbi:Myb DNA-bind 5 domain-containing protein, partial [Aphis craccivora]
CAYNLCYRKVDKKPTDSINYQGDFKFCPITVALCIKLSYQRIFAKVKTENLKSENYKITMKRATIQSYFLYIYLLTFDYYLNTLSESQNEQETNLKKARQGRRNDRQLSFMVDYMVQNPHVATGKFHTLNGKNSLAGSWEDLVTNLNNLRNPGVKEKNVKSWKEANSQIIFLGDIEFSLNPNIYLLKLIKSWKDLKTKVSKKASALRNHKKQTGNKQIELAELSEIDNKVLGLVGYDYVEGTVCPDSWPEELPDDVEQLAGGNYDILNIVPTPLTIRPNQDPDIIEADAEEIIDDPYYTVELIKDSTNEISSLIETNKTMTPHILINVPAESNTSFISETSIDHSSGKQPILPNISAEHSKFSNTPTTNLKKTKRDVKLNTQLSNARAVFTDLAKTNNQQLELLTTSLNMFAESNKQMAAALNKMAENDEKRLLMDEKLVTILSTVISKLN